jgi:hypothetical protein
VEELEGLQKINNGEVIFGIENAPIPQITNSQENKLTTKNPGRCPRCHYNGELKFVVGAFGALHLKCEECNISFKCGYADATKDFDLMDFKCPIDQFPVVRYESKYGRAYVSP